MGVAATAVQGATMWLKSTDPTSTRLCSRVWCGVAPLLVVLASSPTARAQAFVGPPNVLDVSLGAQYATGRGAYVGKIGTGDRPLFGNLVLEDKEGHESYTFRLGVDYSLAFKGLAFSASLPLMKARGTGNANWAWHPGTRCDVTPTSSLSSGS